MSLNAALSLFLEEYPLAVTRPFANDALANFIRHDVASTLQDAIGGNPRYITRGSAGQGEWARAPWAAVFDRFITEGAQDGYYLVYLVKEDFSGIHLSLNQGITSVKRDYGADTKSALRIRAKDFLARLGTRTNGLAIGEIDLAASNGTNLSAYYQAGSICSTFYEKRGIPSDEVLTSDLMRFLDLYFVLVSHESQLFEKADAEDDEISLQEEDLRKLREHKRIERNRKLALRAKQALGYTCTACGFNFEEKYGNLGREFIEAHHLTPVSDLKGQRLLLDPKKDFTVLCSNCHRMIHKTDFVSDVAEFRSRYVVKPE